LLFHPINYIKILNPLNIRSDKMYAIPIWNKDTKSIYFNPASFFITPSVAAHGIYNSEKIMITYAFSGPNPIPKRYSLSSKIPVSPLIFEIPKRTATAYTTTSLA